jgi:hypothetical protein
MDQQKGEGKKRFQGRFLLKVAITTKNTKGTPGGAFRAEKPGSFLARKCW